MKRWNLFENALDKKSKEINDLQEYMNCIFEPFKMIEYNEKSLWINIMNIGQDTENNDWVVSCMNHLFGKPSINKNRRSDINQNNSGNEDDSDSDDSKKQRRNHKKQGKWRWKWSIL